MAKGLLTLLGFGLFLGLGINTYSQSSNEEIPEAIRERAAKCLKYVAYCPGSPIIKKIGEKIEDRAILLNEMTSIEKEKDGIADKITLYEIKNECDWINVPNYLLYSQIGLKEGGFSEKGLITEIISKEIVKEKVVSVPLSEEW